MMRHVFTSKLHLFTFAALLSMGCDTEKEDADAGDDAADDGATSTSGGTTGSTDDGSDSGDSGDSGGSSDSGVVPTERAVDILLVVDNSGSMGEEQARLAADIDALVDVLDAAEPPVDYRIAVTTTDNGNPWCQGTSSENGQFRATSCRDRTADFVFEGAATIDVTNEACLDICTIDDLGLTVPWVDVDGATGTSNLPGGDVKGALHCLLPQGINGCGFEQPLESLSRALERLEDPADVNFGFRREGALLAVAMVTDEVDCSFNPEHETIFLPEGNRVFWSDDSFPAPTSAVCWNAGVECTGMGVYEECHAVNLDVNGVPTLVEDEAVLNPLSGYIGQLSGLGAYVFAINGVSADGTPVYADGADPDFQNDFGIGAGCDSAAGSAVPPVRIRELIETVSGPDSLHSVCEPTFSPAFTSMGNGILDRLP